ncbi:MAG: hypothetical protein V8R85_03750 [Frisingicoccus sp.]
MLICDNDNVSFDNSKPGGVLGTPGFMAPEIVGREKTIKGYRSVLFVCIAVLPFYG